MLRKLKFNKKGEDGAAASGFSTIVRWAIIIGVAIILIVIMANFTEIGRVAWTKITNAFAFV